MALSGSDCRTCGVSNKYNQDSSVTSKVISTNQRSDPTDYFDKTILSTQTYTGNMVSDDISFKFNNNQAIKINIVFMEITSCSKSFVS